MKVFQKILSLTLVLAMLCGFLPGVTVSACATEVNMQESTAHVEEIQPTTEAVPALTASSAIASGSCGDNLTWFYNETTSTLTISGSGDMYDYPQNGTPWYSYTCTSVIIEDGVTSIGARAFYNLRDSEGGIELESITIPNTVTSIGDAAFYQCYSLSSITLPNSVTYIGKSAFSNCRSLSSITLSDNLTSISDWTFDCCFSLSSITLPDSVTHIGNYAFDCCIKLGKITFLGDAPVFDDFALDDITVTVYYPAGNTTWTADVMQNYGGTITWVPVTKEHIFGEATYIWSEDFTTCTAVRVCTNSGCAVEETETVSSTVVTQTATCTEDGKATYTADFDFEAFETQTKEIILEKTGHSTVTDKGSEATCTKDGLTDGSHCVRCNEVLVDQETIPALGHAWDNGTVTKEPTEEETGIRTYNCENCDETKTEIIEKLEHTHKYESVVTAPTCTEAGYTTNTCKCGDSFVSDKVDALGHTEVVDKGKAATCTEAGLTDETYCERCSTVLTKQEEIPALGHSWDNGTITKEPTEEENGIRTFNCENCEETRTETIDKLQHRPLREFCVSDFRQNQEYHIINVHGGGLFPLFTSVPGGWDGMRAGTA